MLTLYGTIDVADSSMNYNDGREMRVGLEITIPDRKFAWREQILFFGTISEKKFSKAVVGRKNGRELNNWDNWTRNT